MKTILICIAILLTSCTKNKPFLDKRLKTYRYPYKTKIYNYLSQSQKVSMDYLIKEDKKKSYPPRKTVIFVHDINTVGAQWENLAELFYNAGYRVLIPDLIGMGRSLKPEGYQYSTNTYAYMLKKFIKWYQIKTPLLVGSGFGSDIINTYSHMLNPNYSKAFLINPTFFIGEDVTRNYMSIDQIYEKELNKSLDDIKSFLSEKLDITSPSGAHLLWLHQGLKQGVDWRELAFTRAKIMHHYVYSNKVTNKLHENVFILYGENAKYQPASYFKSQNDYIKKLRFNFKRIIQIQNSGFHPEIDNAQIVFEQIKSKI